MHRLGRGGVPELVLRRPLLLAPGSWLPWAHAAAHSAHPPRP